jgi:hypothetical protein
MATTAPTTDQMIARVVSKGGNPEDSAKLLAKLLAAHSGINLVSALVYYDFATVAKASTFALNN